MHMYQKDKLFIAPIDGTYKVSEREEIMQAKIKQVESLLKDELPHWKEQLLKW